LPGAFTKTLAARPVKPVFSHEWKDPIGVCHKVEEWMPGDPRLPKSTPMGDPWPKEAGALVADVGFNMRTQRGRDVFEQVKQWHEEGGGAQWSIGYVVPPGGATKRRGVRLIHELKLYEVSPVLHGAHPLTMALEIKSGQGAAEGMEYKATGAVDVLELEQETEDGVKVAGLVVKAADTGRVLMIQRALDDDDPAAGTWEWPGGHLEDGEDPLVAGLREWHEETGSTLPGTASVVGSWTAPNGIYRGYVAVIPAEASMPINTPHDERRVANPDDPDGEATEVTAWWPLTAIPDMPLLRPACRDTPWSLLAGATLPQGPPDDEKPTPQARFAAAVMGTLQALAGRQVKTAHQAVAAARITAGIETKTAHQAVMEAKGGIPGVADTPGDHGNARNLINWYDHGGGAAEIAWGTEGDFDRCVAIAGKHMSPEQAKGFCNLRHHDALGIYPATHAAMDRKSAPTLLEEKMMTPSAMPGSYEEQRRQIQSAVRTLLQPNDEDGGVDCGYVCLEATYPDHVIVSVEKPQEPEPETYKIPYTMQGDDVLLGEPQEVELMVVAVPDTDDGSTEGGEEQGEASDDEAQQARFLTPAAANLDDATSALAVADVDPHHLELLRPSLQELLATLSRKGMPVPTMGDEPDDQPYDTGDWQDGWDTGDDNPDSPDATALKTAGALGMDEDTNPDDDPDAEPDSSGSEPTGGEGDEQVSYDPADIEKELQELNA
jgi:8-oxo-dGTP pyrophosphatase MutT (NUDIX family)